mgnify:CR=1 FL=1
MYNCYILPILTYNCGTWSLNAPLENIINIAHRKQLRQILNFKWFHKISNKYLYEITNSKSISTLARSARWRLFGHILRLLEETPAFQCMVNFFNCSASKKIGKPKYNLVSTLQHDCKRLGAFSLTSENDLFYLQNIASDRKTWKHLVEQLYFD